MTGTLSRHTWLSLLIQRQLDCFSFSKPFQRKTFLHQSVSPLHLHNYIHNLLFQVPPLPPPIPPTIPILPHPAQTYSWPGHSLSVARTVSGLSPCRGGSCLPSTQCVAHILSSWPPSAWWCCPSGPWWCSSYTWTRRSLSWTAPCPTQRTSWVQWRTLPAVTGEDSL